MLRKIKVLIEKLEQKTIPLYAYFLCLLSVVIIENFLEVFSDTAVVHFRLLAFYHPLSVPASISIAISIAHIFLWWVAITLLLPIILARIIKEDIFKTMRVFLSFSWVILVTPIFDLIVSGGKGVDIRYATPKTIAELVCIFKYLTPGENLTVALILILICLYILVKTKSVFKAALGVLLSSLVIGVFFLFPSLIKQTARLVGANIPFVNPIPIIRILLLLIWVEVFMILRLGYKRAILPFKKNEAALILHFLLLFVLGIGLCRPDIATYILRNAGTFLLTIIAIICSYYIAKQIQPPIANIKQILLAGSIGALSAFCVNSQTLFLILTCLALFMIYKLEPMALHQYTLLANLPLAFIMLLTVILGWLFAGGQIWVFPPIIILYFLIFVTACLNILDLDGERIELFQNKTAGSLLKLFPEKKVKFIAAALFLVAYTILPLIILDKLLVIPCLLLGSIQFYLINKQKANLKLVFNIYLASIILLIFWLSLRGYPLHI